MDFEGMPNRIAEGATPIDPEIGKAVAEAIGERLRMDARPEDLALLPVRLQLLLDELRTQDNKT
jgi:hypothetical protein